MEPRSSDGVQLLTNSGDNVLRVFNIEIEKNQKEKSGDLKVKSEFDIGEAISYPATCCALMSTRDQPIKIIDTNTGITRAKYKAFDDKEQILTAYSASFNRCGDKIYMGSWERINIFDVQTPGYPIREIKTSPDRKSRDGQKGIISCIDFPLLTSMSTDIFASGSFSGSIAVWDVRKNTNELTWKVKNHLGDGRGITSVQFSPCGNYIFSGARKSNYIGCWDLRNTSKPVTKYRRGCHTQQRMGFVVDHYQKYLISGQHDGKISFFDLCKNNLTEPSFEFEDFVGDVSLHPFIPMLASVSGQRHFDSVLRLEENNEGVESGDSSLRIWDISKLINEI
ncbi:hypothetical protein BB558_000732 [Smittium angustum]|uniref:Uncharacterized protein n=1 Tax=Smittium angustum TaxID=133377 RepID=A0A2U1JDK5_SMIAN|nr:hypothetical protein BB558_002115 [Smittium angustum]PWA03099.1 hypothetical protein BB558_000732 [Smittium angustum]